MKKSWFLGVSITSALAITLVASPHGGAQSKSAQQATASAVKIDNFSFGPAAITVPVGTTVTWTNKDDVPHTIVADDKSFKSSALDTDDNFSHTFTKAGTYNYFCSLHPKMVAKVVVQPGSGSMGMGNASMSSAMPGMPEMPGMREASKAPAVQLYTKDGDRLVATIYWISGQKLNYVAGNGAVLTMALDRLDMARTLAENGDENVKGALRVAAKQTVSP